jgi:uncharacterized protein
VMSTPTPTPLPMPAPHLPTPLLPPLPARAAELVQQLGLAPHPEGGFYREIFRSARQVQPDGQRPKRAAMTSIDFLLGPGQFSAWHRVRSDEAWHLLEGAGLRLWLMPPTLDAVQTVLLGSVVLARRPRHVVPADWWQAAEPLAEPAADSLTDQLADSANAYAYVGATVAPGFDFADFAFGRDDARFTAALDSALRADLRRLL